MNKTFQIDKWKIVTDSRDVSGVVRWTVQVYNTNARTYNQLKHNYYFTTEEKRNTWVMDFVNAQKAYNQRKEERKQERKAQPRNNEITVIIKKALANKYGFKNVKVKRGSGTAYGWVEAKVELQKPSDCMGENPFHCTKCKETINNGANEARQIVYKAMKEAGKEFYTYYSDDGYNTERDEFLLHINLI